MTAKFDGKRCEFKCFGSYSLCVINCYLEVPFLNTVLVRNQKMLNCFGPSTFPTLHLNTCLKLRHKKTQSSSILCSCPYILHYIHWYWCELGQCLLQSYPNNSIDKCFIKMDGNCWYCNKEYFKHYPVYCMKHSKNQGMLALIRLLLYLETYM